MKTFVIYSLYYHYQLMLKLIANTAFGDYAYNDNSTGTNTSLLVIEH